MRGINYAHTWFRGDAEKAIPLIAQTGANVIRIVLADGDQYTRDDESSVRRVLDLCKKNKLVAILEVHDATGSDDVEKLRNATQYWISLAPMLKGKENHVIINIANEWFGTSGQAAKWADGYQEVVPSLRSAGLEHLIIVDSPGWGQDAASIAQEGSRIFQADPQRNLIFSIHMYEVAGKNAKTVKRHIDNSLAIGVPVIIGEFSNKQTGKPVAYKSIMQYCQERSVGWLAWSWHGNNKDTANMDLSHGADGGLTDLGNEIVYGPNGIHRHSRIPNIW